MNKDIVKLTQDLATEIYNNKQDYIFEFDDTPKKKSNLANYGYCMSKSSIHNYEKFEELLSYCKEDFNEALLKIDSIVYDQVVNTMLQCWTHDVYLLWKLTDEELEYYNSNGLIVNWDIFKFCDAYENQVDCLTMVSEFSNCTDEELRVRFKHTFYSTLYAILNYCEPVTGEIDKYNNPIIMSHRYKILMYIVYDIKDNLYNKLNKNWANYIRYHIDRNTEYYWSLGLYGFADCITKLLYMIQNEIFIISGSDVVESRAVKDISISIPEEFPYYIKRVVKYRPSFKKGKIFNYTLDRYKKYNNVIDIDLKDNNITDYIAKYQ